MLAGHVNLGREDEYIVFMAYAGQIGPVAQLVAGFRAAVLRQLRWCDHDFYLGP